MEQILGRQQSNRNLVYYVLVLRMKTMRLGYWLFREFSPIPCWRLWSSKARSGHEEEWLEER